jgi:hypothetical protein
MTLNEKTVDRITKSIKFLKNVPTGVYFNFDYSGGLQFEARTLAEVRKIRAAFHTRVWKKNFVEYSEQWEYTTTTSSGVNVRIYGCKEGPAQCKMVTETVMEEREVPSAPITYVKQMVEVKKTRYICPEDKKASK